MKLAIGIDVHKNLCAAHAVNGGVNQPRKKHLDLIEGFNAEFRRFPSDVRGLGRLARYVSGHDVHILIENSTKSHDVYWILRGFGLNVTVAHQTDLKNITESQRKNDDNDARELAHYMRRRLLGENEFHEAHIPDRKVLLRRELCRFTLDDRKDLTAMKLKIRSHLLIRGDSSFDAFGDVASPYVLDRLMQSRDKVLMLDSQKAGQLKKRIGFTEKALEEEFADDPVFRIVRSIPGIGVLTASYISCMGDDFSRFPDGRSYAASIGLIPKQDESADNGKNCGITRRGDQELRRLLTQAAFVHVFRQDSFITQKYNRLRQRNKAHNECLTACANSMARMIWKMVATGREYVQDPDVLRQAREYADSDRLEEDMEAVQRRNRT